MSEFLMYFIKVLKCCCFCVYICQLYNPILIALNRHWSSKKGQKGLFFTFFMHARSTKDFLKKFNRFLEFFIQDLRKKAPGIQALPNFLNLRSQIGNRFNEFWSWQVPNLIHFLDYFKDFLTKKASQGSRCFQNF